MLAQKQYNHYTFKEYLTFEDQSETKNEYHHGYIEAMAGASWEHNQIASNLHAFIHNLLKKKACHVFISNMRVWIEANKRATYPDIVVICGQPEFVESHRDTITNPKVIIEVLSKSTEGEDRGGKFHAYWKLDTLEEYILVDQYTMRLDYFRRENEKLWELQVFTKPDDKVKLKSLNVEIPLSEIYLDVVWN